MKRLIFGAMALGLMLGVPCVSFAQSVVHDMDALDLDGATVKPLGMAVQGRMPARTKSLIKLRANFVDEIVESANAL